MRLIIISILIALLLIVAALVLENPVQKNLSSEKYESISNVKIENGVQIIEIKAKGGYKPRISRAQANIPTVLRFDSKGTFDCSSSVRIPNLKINQSLDFSGLTNIDIGTPKIGTMKGSCSMGMYPFEIEFK